MRWELFFGDLETQLQAASAHDFEAHINELARIDAAQLRFADALRGARDSRVSFVMVTGTAFHGIVQQVHAGWVLVREGERSLVLPLEKISRVHGMGRARATDDRKVPYTLASALRVLARNRAAVLVECDGRVPATCRGVLDHVGADYVQLLQLADGIGRDAENQGGRVLIPIAQIASIASALDNEF